MFNMKGSTQNRRLLQQQVAGDDLEATLPPTMAIKRPFRPNSPFDSSMALTILVLLTALFFLGFFSVYIRRFAEEETAEVRRRRHQSPPSRLHGGGGNNNNNNQKGLDVSTVKSLPLVSYGGAAKHRMIEECTICLSEFQEGEIVKLIPYCRHVFHPACLDTWLVSHVSCPLCRSTQLFKKVDEVCLGVMQDKNGNGVSDQSGESTVNGGDTWREVVTSGLRRSCSYSNLEGRVVLHRSMSI